MITLPRIAAQVLSGHVTLEIRCIDRVLLIPPAAAAPDRPRPPTSRNAPPSLTQSSKSLPGKVADLGIKATRSVLLFVQG